MELSSRWEEVDKWLNDRDRLIESLPLIKSALPQLSGVKSCVMIGCGYGNLELELVGVDGSCPNVTEIVAVDPDAEQMAILKTRVGQLLPSVSVDYYQETAQSWNGADKLFDAVMIFECLYYIPVSERAALFKKLFDNVVAPGGYVIIFIQYQQCLSNPVSAIDHIFRGLITRLDLTPFEETDRARLCEMLTSTGFQFCYELPVESEMRVEPTNDDFLSQFISFSEVTVSRDQVREVVAEEFGDRKSLSYTVSFLVFRKP